MNGITLTMRPCGRQKHGQAARATSRTHRRPARRGAIFITALGVTVILSGLLLVFAQEMRTELIASANRLSAAQAQSVEEGAEQWVLAQIEANPSDAVTITQTPAEALAVGGGYFWVLHPDPDNPQSYAFGISDESAKVNLNAATSDQLMELPGMTEDVADAIVDWHDADSTPGQNGAESSYYESLPEPYDCKNDAFESVGELMLVKGVTEQLLYGYDLNHDGVLDSAESNAGGMSTLFNSAGDDGRGLAPYVTVYSVEPNTDSSGQARINVNNRDTGALRDALRAALSATRADEILARISAVTPGRGGQAFSDLAAFYTTSGMTVDEFKLIADRLTTSSAKTLTGMVNVNTAPRQVLACLPGLESADADALIAKRGGADTTSIAWVFDALPANKLAGVVPAITARSYQYSADIVAVSGDGRAFKRVRIIVDARQTPAKVVYRKELGELGWPLPEEVRVRLRAGQGAMTGLSAAGAFGFSQ